MLKLLSCCAVALALVGCTTSEDLKTGLDQMNGLPVQKAIDRLGKPLGVTDEDGGAKTYVWASNYDRQYSTSAPPSTLGVRDPNDMAGSDAPGSAPESSAATTTNYRCWVRITAGPDGLIKTTDWGGNGDGCGAYAARLR